MTRMTESELAACDGRANKAISAMMAAVAATAIVPAHVNWALTASAIGTGCATIGRAYGIIVTKEHGWALGKQFLIGAGTWFLAMNVGSKIFAMVMESTGIGYAGGAVLDVGISSASAWAIGGCAKAYFRKLVQGNAITKEELKHIFQEQFKKARRTQA